MLVGNADGVMDGELLETDDGLLGVNDDNTVGSDDVYVENILKRSLIKQVSK